MTVRTQFTQRALWSFTITSNILSPGLKSDILHGKTSIKCRNLPLQRISSAVLLVYNTILLTENQAFFSFFCKKIQNFFQYIVTNIFTYKFYFGMAFFISRYASKLLCNKYSFYMFSSSVSIPLRTKTSPNIMIVEPFGTIISLFRFIITTRTPSGISASNSV